MATVEGLSEVQAIVEYNFRSINLLGLALTAAGADEKIYDGNRKMAQLGENRLLSFCLLMMLSWLDAPEVKSHLYHQGAQSLTLQAEVSKKVTSATARKCSSRGVNF